MFEMNIKCNLILVTAVFIFHKSSLFYAARQKNPSALKGGLFPEISRKRRRIGIVKDWTIITATVEGLEQ